MINGPKRRAQTACNDSGLANDLRLNRNRTVNHKLRVLANNTAAN